MYCSPFRERLIRRVDGLTEWWRELGATSDHWDDVWQAGRFVSIECVRRG